jgi:hypothetical protein
MPDSLLNFVLKSTVSVGINRMQKEGVFASKDVVQKVEENKEFYDMIKESLKGIGIEMPCN